VSTRILKLIASMTPAVEDENGIILEVLFCCCPPQPDMINIIGSDKKITAVLFIQTFHPIQTTRKRRYFGMTKKVIITLNNGIKKQLTKLYIKSSEK
jgi:hypothetical protein